MPGGTEGKDPPQPGVAVMDNGPDVDTKAKSRIERAAALRKGRERLAVLRARKAERDIRAAALASLDDLQPCPPGAATHNKTAPTGHEDTPPPPLGEAADNKTSTAPAEQPVAQPPTSATSDAHVPTGLGTDMEKTPESAPSGVHIGSENNEERLSAQALSTIDASGNIDTDTPTTSTSTPHPPTAETTPTPTTPPPPYLPTQPYVRHVAAIARLLFVPMAEHDAITTGAIGQVWEHPGYLATMGEGPGKEIPGCHPAGYTPEGMNWPEGPPERPVQPWMPGGGTGTCIWTASKSAPPSGSVAELADACIEYYNDFGYGDLDDHVGRAEARRACAGYLQPAASPDPATSTTSPWTALLLTLIKPTPTTPPPLHLPQHKDLPRSPTDVTSFYYCDEGPGCCDITDPFCGGAAVMPGDDPETLQRKLDNKDPRTQGPTEGTVNPGAKPRGAKPKQQKPAGPGAAADDAADGVKEAAEAAGEEAGQARCEPPTRRGKRPHMPGAPDGQRRWLNELPPLWAQLAGRELADDGDGHQRGRARPGQPQQPEVPRTLLPPEGVRAPPQKPTEEGGRQGCRYRLRHRVARHPGGGAASAPLVEGGLPPPTCP